MLNVVDYLRIVGCWLYPTLLTMSVWPISCDLHMARAEAVEVASLGFINLCDNNFYEKLSELLEAYVYY